VKLLISDANILIDIVEGEVVDPVFELPYEMCTPDLLYYDELATHHPDLVEKGLALKDVQGEFLLQVPALQEKYKKPSRYDCLALALATQEGCPLLTGDKYLRAAAEQENVEVYGTLWLIDRAVEHGVLSQEGARLAFCRMRQAGRRLPWSTVEDRYGALVWPS